MTYPATRLRRLRTNASIRRLVSQTHLSVDDLVYPMFVCPGKGIKDPIKSMDGCFHFSPENAATQAREVAAMGIPAILLFGLPSTKDAGCDRFRGLVCRQRCCRIDQADQRCRAGTGGRDGCLFMCLYGSWSLRCS
ncbi:MAG: hypothetical protein ACYSSK_01080 [Planctomycetota bacterium]